MTQMSEEAAMIQGRTITITRRRDGLKSTVLDVTGWSDPDLDRLWDGLVRKVDFEVWEPVYSPPRGEDETLGSWARGATEASPAEVRAKAYLTHHFYYGGHNE